MDLERAGFWRPVTKTHLGFMRQVGDFIYRVHIAYPFLLRDLRRGQRLIVTSDYGGEHAGADVATYSFLLSDNMSIQPFLSAVSQLRAQGLGSRRMAYKNLNDAVRSRMLIPFLTFADSIYGVLFTVAVAKEVDLFAAEVLRAEHQLLPDFKPAEARKLLLVCHWMSLLVAGLVGPGQDIDWLSDNDAIAASHRHLMSLTNVFGHFLNHYLSCDVGHIRVGTTQNDPGDLTVEDLASLPDLAAGGLCEVLTTQGVLPLEETKGKARSVIGWLCNRQAALAKVNIVIRNSPDGRLLIELLTPKRIPTMPLSEFRIEVENTIRSYEETIGHAANRARKMIETHGEVGALSRLMISADLQQGFKVLRDHGRIDQTFEALVVKYNHMFKPEVVQAAKWRLENPNELF